MEQEEMLMMEKQKFEELIKARTVPLKERIEKQRVELVNAKADVSELKTKVRETTG
jgi:hypothetical protein